MQGSITKTGNSHARRLLVEAAWHHRARYRVGKTMRDRWDLAPPPPGPAATRATDGCTTAGSSSSTARKKPTVANVAIARELAGWCWSLAVLDELAPHDLLRRPTALVAARGATRESPMSSDRSRARRSTLDTRTRSSRTPVLR